METKTTRAAAQRNRLQTEETLLFAGRRRAAQAHVAAAHRAEEEAVGGLFKAVVWGYFGSAAGLLALALLGLSGAHIPWVHIARGIVTGS